MWNNAEHLAAYLAVPSMGAVLHTLNLRLFPEQLTYIANHAEDRVIIVDSTLIPLLARVLPELHTVEHVVVVGGGDPAPFDGRRRRSRCTAGTTCSPASRRRYDWPEVDERDAAALCYTSGTTGNPKGVAYSHRSIWLHSMQVCMAESFGLVAARPATSSSCRCSTRWPGACRTRRSCPAPTCSCRTGSCRPRRSPR